MGEARRKKQQLIDGHIVPPVMVRCHYCGELLDISKAHFVYLGEKTYRWHATPRQCFGKDVVRIVLCIERGVL